MADSDISSMKADIKKAATDIKVNIFSKHSIWYKNMFSFRKERPNIFRPVIRE